MISLLRASLRTFKQTYRQYLLLGALSLLLASFLFVPAIAWLFNRLLRVFGSGYLLNSDLIRMIFDVRSLTFFILMLLLLVLAFFIEFTIILVVAREGYFQRRVALSDALLTAWYRIPRILGFGLLQLLFLLILLSPLVDNPLIDYLLGYFNLSLFIRTLITGSAFWFVLYSLTALIILYWMLRTLFTLHFIVLSNQPVGKAIRYSFIMTRGRLLNMILSLALFNLVTVVLALFVFSFANRIPGLLQLRFSISLIENILMVATSYLTFLAALLLVPINMIFLTRLFYRYHDNRTPGDQGFIIYKSRWLGRLEQAVSKRLHGRPLVIRLVLSVCLIITFLLNFNLYQQAAYLRWNVLVISHRGDLASAPENSLSSIRSAIEKSVDLIEIDVMLSRDGVPVLHHDATLRRLAGIDQRVADLTYAELRQVDIGTRFDPAFAGETIASLHDAVDLILSEENTHSQLLIDLKPDDRWVELAEKVVAIIEENDLVDICYVQSFNSVTLQYIRKLNPDIRIGQLLTWAIGDLSRLDVDFYAINKTMISDEFIRRARRQDRQVWVWTVNDERSMREMLRFDIDGIITDYPERLQNLIALPPGLDVLVLEDDDLGAEAGSLP